MHIICKVNNKELDILNNEKFAINMILDNQITISNNEKELIINAQDFQSIFNAAYCITIHSSQGETFNEPYTIYDWNILDKRLRYVALTRSSDLSNVNIL